ncbi:MAG: hypothetical protein AAB325_09030 [Pseudomonadota bacterium]
MNVELIYDADCPNVAATRSLLIKAFARTGVSARWQEWERGSPESPDHVRDFGSPTILVDGEDIAGIGPAAGIRACRVYSDSGGILRAAPPLDLICAALLEDAATRRHGVAGRGRWQATVASMPAIGTALLPKLTCPLCLPAYAALLSALGLKFFDYTPYLLSLTLAFLAFALGALALHARRTGHWIALMTGVAAAAIVLLGKFTFELDWLNTVGIGLLVIAILISMRRKASPTLPCRECVESGSQAKAGVH